MLSHDPFDRMMLELIRVKYDDVNAVMDGKGSEDYGNVYEELKSMFYDK